MSFMEILTALLSLIAGIGVFLIACKMMSSNLESVSSHHLRSLFSKASGNPLIGVGIGTAGTALIQSSGATTVMVIGFVNAGILTVSQSAPVIYGANIGTTVTGQIVALGMFSSDFISTTVIFSAFAGIGAMISTFSKKDNLRRIGGILSGFGMLFIGLSMMGNAMEIFAEDPSVRAGLSRVENPLLLVLIGTLLTAVVQSSSVMTSVAITMAVAGLISVDQGIYLTMGSNIGACVVALVAGLTGNRNAKKTALIPLIFNFAGIVVFLLVEWIAALFSGGAFSYSGLFALLFPGLPQTQLAMFHTFFNIAKTLLFLPLTKVLIRVAECLLPKNSKSQEDRPHFYCVDEHLLRTPAIAVNQVKKEILNMAEIAMENFRIACTIVKTQDYTQADAFKKSEEQLNFLNLELPAYVVRINEKEISTRDKLYLSTVFRTVVDLERIGDYAENIIEYADELKKNGERFSNDAVAEIGAVEKLIFDVFDHALNAYRNADLSEIKQTKFLEEMVDDVTEEMENCHIERLNAGSCTPNAGAQYLSLASDMERISDHLMNVANSISVYKK